jgi:Fur family transcriptional regulator, peroxide stress response regulator
MASTTTDQLLPSAEATLRSVLESNGQRFTEQRSAVYQFLCGTTDHPTADEVFTAVRGRISDISLATVYKALETFVSCNLATKLTYGDGSARYDARTDEHFHARCLACGSVRDVHSSCIAGSLPEVRPTDGFQVQGYRVELVGYCSNCSV